MWSRACWGAWPTCLALTAQVGGWWGAAGGKGVHVAGAWEASAASYLALNFFLPNLPTADTLSAAYYAQFALNGGRPVGQSIPATEHSVMTSWPTGEARVVLAPPAGRQATQSAAATD